MPLHPVAARVCQPAAWTTCLRACRPAAARALWILPALSLTTLAVAENIAGYASDESVVQGDTLDLHVSTNA